LTARGNTLERKKELKRARERERKKERERESERHREIDIEREKKERERERERENERETMSLWDYIPLPDTAALRKPLTSTMFSAGSRHVSLNFEARKRQTAANS
jgi:hypothetical protein